MSSHDVRPTRAEHVAVGWHLALPRLSRRAGFWAIAGSFLAVTAFSTAPSSLYGLYAHRDHLAPLTVTKRLLLPQLLDSCCHVVREIEGGARF